MSAEDILDRFAEFVPRGRVRPQQPGGPRPR